MMDLNFIFLLIGCILAGAVVGSILGIMIAKVLIKVFSL